MRKGYWNFILVIFGVLGRVCLANDMLVLDPRDAFRLSGGLKSPETVALIFNIKERHYLYKSKFKIIPMPESIQIGDPIYPASETHTDEFFGETEIFRNKATILVPLINESIQQFRIKVTAQGCSDDGFCYLPFDQIVNIYGF